MQNPCGGPPLCPPSLLGPPQKMRFESPLLVASHSLTEAGDGCTKSSFLEHRSPQIRTETSVKRCDRSKQTRSIVQRTQALGFRVRAQYENPSPFFKRSNPRVSVSSGKHTAVHPDPHLLVERFGRNVSQPGNTYDFRETWGLSTRQRFWLKYYHQGTRRIEFRIKHLLCHHL